MNTMMHSARRLLVLSMMLLGMTSVNLAQNTVPQIRTGTQAPTVLAQTDRGQFVGPRNTIPQAQICKEMKLVDRGHPGKGDAVYETVTVDCPGDRSANTDAQQAKLCGQRTLIKRGYPGQGEEVLESVEIRCPTDQAARGSDERRTGMEESTLCEAQRLVRRGDPGKGEDVFETVLVDCPMGRS